MAIKDNEKFATAAQLKPTGDRMNLKGAIPGEGLAKGEIANVRVTAIDPHHSREIVLMQKLAEGGEGSVFSTSVPQYVAKIYKPDKITVGRKDKLKLMISKPISCEGVCFPEAIILNGSGEFVGYLMKQASGFELGKSVFQPKLLLQKFPGWTRKDTIQLCLTILEKIKYLNDRNVILGDINPANILVVSPAEVYFVDCDSYQVAGYPCPVGTANFTPPEAQGRDYKTFLRTQEMENFAVATLLFMIMLPGKPPYSVVGGESPEHNIKNGDFPYPHSDEDGSKMPAGLWGFIWSHMSFRAREAFFQTFKKGESHYAPEARYSADEWADIFEGYLYGADYMLKADPMAMDIFPTRVKMKKCKADGCEEHFIPTDTNWSFCPKHAYMLSGRRNSSSVTRIQASMNSQSRAAVAAPATAPAVPQVTSHISSIRDHQGRAYSSKAQMCSAWNVPVSTYDWRCKAGWTVEEALTGRRHQAVTQSRVTTTSQPASMPALSTATRQQTGKIVSQAKAPAPANSKIVSSQPAVQSPKAPSATKTTASSTSSSKEGPGCVGSLLIILLLLLFSPLGLAILGSL